MGPLARWNRYFKGSQFWRATNGQDDRVSIDSRGQVSREHAVVVGHRATDNGTRTSLVPAYTQGLGCRG